MQNLLEKFDWLADIETGNALTRLLERAIFAFMILMFVSAPHSIAATQISWLVGMFLWVIRLFLKPRPRLVKTPLDAALWAFLGWSIVTSIFSYAPAISIDRLRGTLLFLIFYFVINVVRTKRAIIFLAFAMVFSCMVNVVWTPIQRIIGRGVEIHGIAPNSPLAKVLIPDGSLAKLEEGDALLTANDVKLKTPEDLVAQIERGETTKVKFYRPDFEFTVDVRRENLLAGGSALERLGIESWKRSRNWRSTGFYSHYVTYAEVLQLILSLAFGLLITSFSERKDHIINEPESAESRKSKIKNRFFQFFPFSFSPFFLICVAGMSLALLLTVTRASQLAFLISALIIIIADGNRKLLLAALIIAVPVAVSGLVFLQQSRHVGMFDQTDDSTLYRETMYRDGVRLWTDNPRHFFLGVGMDSIRVEENWRNWQLYDGGRLPKGHFHSTPLQLLVERGLPALLIWLWTLCIYLRMLIRALKFKIQDSEVKDSNLKSEIRNPKSFDWREKGIILGSLGGAIGFFISGLVQYNLGDAEVVMVFFMLMGLSISLSIANKENILIRNS